MAPPASVIILQAELRGWRHRLSSRSSARAILLTIFLALAAIVFGGSAFSVGAASSHFLPSVRDALLAGGFTALSVLMLVLGFPTVIATLFVGRDLLQLVLAPIRSFEILLARSLVAMSANLLISGILLAGVLGVGFGAGAPPVYYPLALVLVVVQVLVITAFQATLMSMVLRWVPARLARDVAAAVAGVSGAGFYLAWNLSLRQAFVSGNSANISNFAAVVRRVDWLPSAWPGHALSATIAGATGGVVAWTLFTLGLGALLLCVAGILYQSTLLAGLGVFGGSQARWRRRASTNPRPDPSRGPGSPARAIARKDWLGYRRDVRRLIRLVPALLFPVGYALAFLRPSGGFNGFWSEAFLVAFITMFMSTALATPSIPSERRGFQLIRMSPLTMGRLIRAKIALTAVPVLVLTSAINLVIGFAAGEGPTQIVELAVLVAWLGVGFVSIGVSTGAIDPHFDAQDDRRAVGLVGSLSGIAATLAFGILSVGAFGLLLLAPGVAGGTANLGPIPATPTVAAAFAGGAVLLISGAATVVAIMLWLANTRLGAYQSAIAAT
ncbi:MAG: hypothetical protein ACHQ0J_08825 [Candidatus Dormibacterales bacterium]